MKAIVQDKYGSPEVLELRDIDKPEIGDDEVLVRIRAADVNPADWAIMSGLPYIARPVYGLRKPKNAVRGTDVAGTIEAAGTGVTRLQPGDEVFGWCDGSFADYARRSMFLVRFEIQIGVDWTCARAEPARLAPVFSCLTVLPLWLLLCHHNSAVPKDAKFDAEPRRREALAQRPIPLAS